MRRDSMFYEEGNVVVPNRIREARVSRAMSLSELADQIGVTKQAISKYELGAINISSTVLINIAQVLNFPINFFLKPKEISENNYSESITFFRSLRSTNKKIREALEQKIDFMNEIFLFLNKYIDFPQTEKIPFVGFTRSSDNEEIEELASRLRELWGLGTKPISNLTNLLLKKGFVISRAKLETESVDAYSHWKNGRYFIILGSDKECAVRSRFDLAHELGHLIIHLDIDEDEFAKNHKLIEREADKFAAAFLLPREEFLKDIYNISLDYFVYLKEKWKVSIGAMIIRCHDLGIITDEQYTNIYKQYIARKWRANEPLDDIIKFEVPTMFKEAFDLLIEHNILTPEEFLEKIALNNEEIENLCFLPDNYFVQYINKQTKPALRIIK